MDNLVLKLIGQRVRDLRKLRNLSQEQLGELAGYHFSYIGGLERGQKNISLLNLDKIALALNVPLHELFLYGRQLKREKNNDKDKIINDIHEKLVVMSPNELRKLQRLMDEFFT
ncbi:transcriptional regulator with XRE-family HTH domain [Paenibacillus phyllosphaerae]|uniref:Transcriptional regulator with XRE-family HTH domain n=1 Tax=Paenibacillus phyllosphaerae TaxID=274593 RepID=A0A7W5B2Y1_9BACL|nr:helix-turn-helix transcriptional regulator [Paenibacillus phyllosphaerae]MBB3113463.1 transcriptional regulator with XRE-family HTH domain [Paenibacillus phyllosphaerae]